MGNVQAKAARFERTHSVVGIIVLALMSGSASADGRSIKPAAGAVAIKADRLAGVPSPVATDNFRTNDDANLAARLKTISSVKTWAAQIQSLNIAAARAAPVDLIVADATAGGPDGLALTASDVAALKVKPDGSRRLALAYLESFEHANAGRNRVSIPPDQSVRQLKGPGPVLSTKHWRSHSSCMPYSGFLQKTPSASR